VNREIEELLHTPEPPQLGPESRKVTKSVTEIDRALGAGSDPLVRATILLWHDHLEEAHTIAQDIKSRDGSYLHGIMHRREPDYSNAKYWFNRVGEHPCFKPLAEEALSLLADEPMLAKRLVPKGQWDAYAFIDTCDEAEKGRLSPEQTTLLRKIQAAELTLLLREFLSRPDRC
jgi:hypothetical protein